MYEQTGQIVPDTEDPYQVLEQVLDHEGYAVERIQLTEKSPLPDTFDTLVILNPRQLNDRQRWEINQALVSGKSVIVAVQQYKWDYLQVRGQLSMNVQEESPGINELLEAYGLTVEDSFLMDVNKAPLSVQVSNNPLMGMRSIDSPTHILVNNTAMAQDVSITSRLSPIFYLWGTALNLDTAALTAHNLEAHTLISSSKQAWKAPKGEKLSTDMFQNPNTTDGPYPLAALIKGQFPDVYADTAQPPWPETSADTETDEDQTELTPAPGQLIVLGCSQLFRRDFLQAGNLDLFINSVDALTLGDDLVNVRSTKPLNRMIDLPNARARSIWKCVNYLLANIIIATVGLSSAAMRRRSRNAYTLSYMNAHND